MNRVMLSILLTMIAAVHGQGQGCLRANNPNGLPPFMTYRGFNERREIIPELHQAIVPSYRFTCCGKITEWGVDVSRGGSRFDGIYDLDLQVWRPSPTVLTTGCYSLVGNNRFTSVPLANGVAVVTPSPQEQIQFQPGDVLGFMMENPHGRNGGVVLLVDSPEQDGGYETEEVWHADVSNTLINNAQCPFPVGPGRILTTSTSAAPVISVSYSTTQCSYNIVATTQAPMSPQPTLIDTSQAPTPIQPMLTDISRPNPVTNPEEPDKPLTPPQPTLTDTDSSRPNPVTNPDKPEKATDSVSDQSATENTDLSHSSDTFSNIGLIAGTIAAVALMVTVIITLTAVLGFIYIKRVKNQKDDIPVATNEACGAGLQDTAIYAGGNTYDNPRGNDRARSSIDTKMNEAYAMHAEAKPCIAYATSAIKPRVAYEVPTNAMTKPCAAYGICTSAVTNPRVAYATDITTEGNDAYGITLQDVAMCGKRDAHDHPNIDS